MNCIVLQCIDRAKNNRYNCRKGFSKMADHIQSIIDGTCHKRFICKNKNVFTILSRRTQAKKARLKFIKNNKGALIAYIDDLLVTYIISFKNNDGFIYYGKLDLVSAKRNTCKQRENIEAYTMDFKKGNKNSLYLKLLSALEPNTKKTADLNQFFNEIKNNAQLSARYQFCDLIISRAFSSDTSTTIKKYNAMTAQKAR